MRRGDQPSAGDLDRYVTIQQATETRSGSGGVTETWSTLAQVFGMVEPLQGNERFAAQAVNADITARIWIYYRDDVTPKMQAVSEGSAYDILSVIDPYKSHVWLQLMVKERDV